LASELVLLLAAATALFAVHRYLVGRAREAGRAQGVRNMLDMLYILRRDGEISVEGLTVAEIVSASIAAGYFEDGEDWPN
jgi:hypothetical protein